MHQNQGTLLPELRMESRFLGARTVRVYLPPSYEREPRRKYPVLYLHDGQNVFSSAGRHCCYGWGSWELDCTADRLIAEGRMREILMVAVDHTRSRYKEYRGRMRPAISTKGPRGARTLDNAGFEAYASFLIRELKPRMERDFRALKSAANTGVMGSSMGGIASLALAWDYPATFGRAASLSGAFQVERGNFLERVLRSHRGPRKSFRIYLDSGVLDDSGEEDGRQETDAVAAELRRLGWKDGRTLLHFTDTRSWTEGELEHAGLAREKWDELRRNQHNEFHWRHRAWRALEFLFPPARFRTRAGQ